MRYTIWILCTLGVACGDPGQLERPDGESYDALGAIKARCKVLPEQPELDTKMEVEVVRLPARRSIRVRVRDSAGTRTLDGRSDELGAHRVATAARTLGRGSVKVTVLRKDGGEARAATCRFEVVPVAGEPDAGFFSDAPVLNGDSGSTPDAGAPGVDQGVVTGSQSFNPGHYLKAFTDQPATAWAWIFNEPKIRGVMWEVNWADVEVAEGVYDFTKIRERLDYLAANQKRSIIEVRDRSFHTSDPKGILPDYLMRDPRYGGGYVVTHKKDGSARGLIAKVWLAPVTERLNRLLVALGKELDGHPYLEAVQIGESSAGFGGQLPSDYTPEVYVEQLRLQTLAGVTAFPHHFFAVGANFINGGGISGPLPGVMVDNTVKAKAGVKEPDLHSAAGTSNRTPTQRYVDDHHVGDIPRVAVGSFSSMNNDTVDALWQVATDPAYGYTHLCWIKNLYDQGILQRMNANGGEVGRMSCPGVMRCASAP